MDKHKTVTRKNEIVNFRGFLIFNDGPYTEIKNSENSKIFTTFVNSKEYVLPEEAGNLRSFRVFDFGPYAEIENSEKSGIFWSVNLFHLKKLEISKVRSSHQKCSVKKVFLKGFTNFTGKHLCWKSPGKHQVSGMQLY